MSSFTLSDEQVDRLNGWPRNDPNFRSTFPYAPSNGVGFGDYLKGLETAALAGTTPLALQLDEVGTLTYIGEADPGSATSSAVWRIKRMDESSTNPDLIIKWASGNDNFDKIWDNRLSLSYS